MANKTVNTRIINKHDTTANWNKATNFIPKAGEIIIYDDVHRIKIGDGKTKVTSLPFSESALDTSITNHINNKNNPHEVTKADVGLSNVDNTSDASKPISTATQTALDKKADKSVLSNYVTTSTLTSTINETVSSINKNIDLLEEEVTTNTTSIQGLVDDVNTLTQSVNNKVDKVSGKELSDNNFTDALLNKLNGIAAGAQVNAVTSVAGKTGAVTLSKADVGLNSVVNAGQTATPANGSTSYFTAGGAYTLQQAINGKANSSHTHTSSQITDLQDKLDTKANASHTHTISQISDLHADWDAKLKVTPAAQMTRWPTISEVTNKTNLTISLNGGTTEGTNKFTYNGVTAKNINITPASIGAATTSHSHSYLPLSGGTLTGTLTGTTISATSFRGTSMSLTGTISGATIRGTTIYEGSATLSSKYALKTEIPEGIEFIDLTV